MEKTTMSDEDDRIDAKTAAAILKISRGEIYYLRKLNRLPFRCYQPLPQKYFFSRKEVEAYRDSRWKQ